MKVFKIQQLTTITLLLTFVIMLASCGSSRRVVGLEEGWELLGSSKVNFVRDVDEVDVNNHNQYTAIRFRVEQRDVRINDLKIIYQNGDKLEPSINDVIPAGQSSKIIELALDGRYIDKIQFKYRTTGNVLKGRANVLIIGRRYYQGY